MKIKKIVAAVAAAAIAVSAMAINAFAADYTAKIGFADTAWAAQDWESSVSVTGDGTYTVTSELAAGAVDFGVFVVDIEGMFAGSPDATAVLDKVTVDGSDISFDASKIIYGDIEEKGNFRIEIYNQYGDTLNNAPVNNNTAVASKLEVTFTVSGLGGAAPAADTTAEAPASDSTTASSTTGNTAAIAIVSVMALAGMAAVATKKRK